MDYVIVVNDAGELKTISATELGSSASVELMDQLETDLNAILDRRAEAGGDYNPAENIVPVVVVVDEQTDDQFKAVSA